MALLADWLSAKCDARNLCRTRRRSVSLRKDHDDGRVARTFDRRHTSSSRPLPVESSADCRARLRRRWPYVVVGRVSGGPDGSEAAAAAATEVFHTHAHALGTSTAAVGRGGKSRGEKIALFLFRKVFTLPAAITPLWA